MHRFPGKNAKSEEYETNMRRNDVYDDIWWENVFRAVTTTVTLSYLLLILWLLRHDHAVIGLTFEVIEVTVHIITIVEYSNN